ncbi:leishmanolysin-like peptidase [Cloeon dipterum]|uniref:leishmanolysin-like peptidase n=1 Tax=Cloeon dipterum TaxID=197152 RepID=UPI0032206658
MTVKVKWKVSASIFVLQIYLFGTVFGIFEHRTCSHIPPTEDQVIRGVYLEDEHVIRKRDLDHPLKMLLYYDESVYRLPREKFELINNTILPEAVHFWERALMVRKTANVIRLNRKCVNNQVFFRKGESHVYCKNACEEKTMCGEVQVPESHLDVCRVCNATGQQCAPVTGAVAGAGITNADFVFYISAMETDRCHKGMTVAYAAHCQQESSLDRPIAGHANLCPGTISTKPQELEILLSTVKHEILHALGFSSSLYAFYRDSEGNPLTPRIDNGKPQLNEKLQTRQWSNKVIKTVTRTDWKIHGGNITRTAQMIVLPRVVEEVQRHFGCDSLEGAELEDQGEDGTATTHWEKRVFENEAMTGTHTQNPVYSRITLALMEDTGWYRANYSMAEPLAWGKGLGCDFAKKSCKAWMDSREDLGLSIHPFCNRVKKDPLETECTDDRSSVALCNLVEHSGFLPTKYQNFDHIPHIEPGSEGKYGGSVALADYCPYIQEFSWRAKNVVVRGSHCHFDENNPQVEKNFALESYGEGSRCFDHTGSMWEERTCRQVRLWQHWGSGCYKYNCHGGRINVLVANYTFTCYQKGQQIPIKILADDWLHAGALLCPSCEELCEDELRQNGATCKPPTRPPASYKVQQDELTCGAIQAKSLILLLLASVLAVKLT